MTRRPAPARAPSGPIHLARISIERSRVPGFDRHPFDLAFVRDLDLEFTTAATFFVGENGSGKSTLLEAIADVCRLPVQGGGRTERDDSPTSNAPRSLLAGALRPSFRQRPWDGYFVRAENLVRLADLLEARERDPDFRGDPYYAYGGRSLHTRSHGEAFMAVFEHRMQSGGVVILDEPEAALSPQRQLTLLALLQAYVASNNTQIFVATHSPILMTLPGARLLEIRAEGIAETRLEDTSHYQITRGILESPERYWKHLRTAADESR